MKKDNEKSRVKLEVDAPLRTDVGDPGGWGRRDFIGCSTVALKSSERAPPSLPCVLTLASVLIGVLILYAK